MVNLLSTHSAEAVPLFNYLIMSSVNIFEKKEEGFMGLDLVRKITESQMKKDLPELRPGMTVKVGVKIKEGEKTRIQAFEGMVIKVQGSGIGKTFTVRKMSSGVGVERTFPLHSPIVDKIEVLRKGKVRRSRLYYLRKRSGKSARIEEDR